MHVSTPKARTVELKIGDVVAPSMNRRPGRSLKRDVEDANFEVVETPRDVFSTAAQVQLANETFKTRMAYRADAGSFSSDFASVNSVRAQDNQSRSRLGIFDDASRSSLLSTAIGGFMAVPVVAMGVCTILFGTLWVLSGGLGSLVSGQTTVGNGDVHTSSHTALAQPRRPEVEIPVDAVVTSSFKAEDVRPSHGGYTTLNPKPARIDRAGSIFMIRSSDN